MAEQLNFDLPVRAALGRDDFMVSPGNALAVAMIESWTTWPEGKLVLTGPAGAGKTHLAHVWASLSDAQIVSAADLQDHDVNMLAEHCVAVEDVPQIADQPEAMTALFHLHNLMKARKQSLMLTGIGAPMAWGLGLPDLQSRMTGTATCDLGLPDDTLLSAVMGKLFADRQLMPRSDVIPYLATHMERSMDAARQIVAEMDAAALTLQKPLTRGLAARTLDKMGASGS